MIGCHLGVEWANELILFSMNFRSHFCMCHRQIFALTYCEYGGTHYVLDCGPIGLSVVGEVAIIYMEDFQMRAKTEEHPELNTSPW